MTDLVDQEFKLEPEAFQFHHNLEENYAKSPKNPKNATLNHAQWTVLCHLSVFGAIVTNLVEVDLKLEPDQY